MAVDRLAVRKPPVKRKVEDRPVPITLSLDPGMYRRLIKMRKAKGLLYDQDIIRISLSETLERAGF